MALMYSGNVYLYLPTHARTHWFGTMTTLNSENEYDSSRSGQTTSGAATDSGYAGYQYNGQGENGHNVGLSDGQTMNTSQTGYSLSGGQGTSNGPKPEDDRKLFVGGLTWDTTQDDLREYFKSFGNILDCSIKHDPSTGRSRGFGFLIFESKDVVEKVLSQNDHFIKGRKVDPKTAHRRFNATNNQMNTNSHNNPFSQSSLYGVGQSVAMPYANTGSNGTNVNPYSNNRKVFIGGLDPSFPDSQLREYFSKFGKIDEIDLPYDKEKNERRPFCFISFQSEQAAQEVLRLQRHTIGDISVDVKRAKPKTGNNHQQQAQQHLYDPYGQQAGYSNYGNRASSYGAGAYPANDAYTHWNAYTYNQQANPAAYPYGNPTALTSATSSYSQYSDHPSNPQYSYPPTNAADSNEYYSQYGYGAPPSSNVYGDASAYNGSTGGGSYEYSTFYAPMHMGANGGMTDKGVGEQPGNSAVSILSYSVEDKVKSKGLTFAPDKLGIHLYLSFFIIELRSDNLLLLNDVINKSRQ
ncbi:unnamed protein product [Adineta ricciae]|uniref:RRM domain-containing protein n=1 Tax=Adineta ricciae TaxID=249248 RepID=A0A814N3A2_ADIRI|nr:unnamed protein product [Adineta ricciae]